MQPKSEKCIFVGYSEDVKGYRLLQSHCNEFILGRYVIVDENILACEPNLAIVPSSACEPSSMFVTSFVPILVSSSDDDFEDENPPPLLTFLQMRPLNLNQHQLHRFLEGSIQHEK